MALCRRLIKRQVTFSFKSHHADRGRFEIITMSSHRDSDIHIFSAFGSRCRLDYRASSHYRDQAKLLLWRERNFGPWTGQARQANSSISFPSLCAFSREKKVCQVVESVVARIPAALALITCWGQSWQHIIQLPTLLLTQRLPSILCTRLYVIRNDEYNVCTILPHYQRSEHLFD